MLTRVPNGRQHELVDREFNRWQPVKFFPNRRDGFDSKFGEQCIDVRRRLYRLEFISQIHLMR